MNISKEKLNEIIELHVKWLRGEKGGNCANLSGAENTLKVGDKVNYPLFGNGIVLETEVAQQNTLVGFDAPPRELHSGLNAKGYYGGTKYEQKCWWIADKDLNVIKVIKEEPKTTKSNTKVAEKRNGL